MASRGVMNIGLAHDEWKEDEDLKEELFNFVRQNMKREEILDFVAQKHPMYAWSLRALCQRRGWIIPKRFRPSGSQRSGADHMGSRLRIFQKRKQKIPHEMKDVKKSDSNPGPHDQ